MTDNKETSETEGAPEDTKRYKNLDWTMGYTVILSILVGAMAAVFAKILLIGINLTGKYIHPSTMTDLVIEGGIGGATLHVIDIGILALFGVIVGCMSYYLMPNRANRGLSHVIEDVHFNKGQTGVREGLVVGAISAVSIGAGASVGRYGPAVHLGAAAASGVGTFFKLEDQQKLTLSCAGIAAAISCSFLAPLAAVMFVQEVVLRQWRIYQFIPVAAASVTGSEVAKLLEVEFTISSGIVPDTVQPHEFFFFGLVGLACALVAIAFNRSLPKATSWVAQNIKVDNRVKPAIGGLILGCMCFYYPSSLGLGGHETQLAISGDVAIQFCLILLVLKFAATITSLSFGFNGGVFGPSLFMGAMLGAAIGLTVENAGVTVTSISLYAIAGMGAMVSVVIGAVFAAIIALIEMTGKLTPSLPLLFSVSCAYVIVYLFSQSSLIVNQLNGRNKNPFDEIQAKDKKYEGFKPTP